jgi:anthranilate/para-aminobenzoate synthase component II
VPLVWLSGAAMCACGLVVLRMDRPAPTLALCLGWAALLLFAGVRLAAVPVVRKPA